MSKKRKRESSRPAARRSVKRGVDGLVNIEIHNSNEDENASKYLKKKKKKKKKKSGAQRLATSSLGREGVKNSNTASVHRTLHDPQSEDGGNITSDYGSGEAIKPTKRWKANRSKQGSLTRASNGKMASVSLESSRNNIEKTNRHGRQVSGSNSIVHQIGESFQDAVRRFSSTINAPFKQIDSLSSNSAGRTISASSSFSPLHHEICSFVRYIEPRQHSTQQLAYGLAQIQQSIQQCFPFAQLVIFGSQATGLQLPSSDVDVVLFLNLDISETGAPEGFSDRLRFLTSLKSLNNLKQEMRETDETISGATLPKNDKNHIVKCLRKILKRLHSLRSNSLVILHTELIRTARVPLLKITSLIKNVTMKVAAADNSSLPKGRLSLNIDISIGTVNGISAIATIQSFMKEFNSLRPIALIIKSMLKEKRLNDVSTGGVGSYVLINMITAYLIHLKKQQSSLPQQSFGSSKDCTQDLGFLLVGFLRYYGLEFDYTSTTVSVSKGGFCTRLSPILSLSANKIKDETGFKVRKKRVRSFNLSVEDPQEKGREMAKGTVRVVEIRKLFHGAHSEIATLCEPMSVDEDEAGGGNYRYLGRILNTRKTLSDVYGHDQCNIQAEGKFDDALVSQSRKKPAWRKKSKRHSRKNFK